MSCVCCQHHLCTTQLFNLQQQQRQQRGWRQRQQQQKRQQQQHQQWQQRRQQRRQQWQQQKVTTTTTTTTTTRSLEWHCLHTVMQLQQQQQKLRNLGQSPTWGHLTRKTWCGHYPAVLIIITWNSWKPQNPSHKKPGFNPLPQNPIKSTGSGFFKIKPGFFSTLVYVAKVNCEAGWQLGVALQTPTKNRQTTNRYVPPQ